MDAGNAGVTHAMVILQKYSLLIPAQLAKLELASHGIESVILDEALASLAPCFTMGEIRLAVDEDDEREARAVLDAMIGNREEY